MLNVEFNLDDAQRIWKEEGMKRGMKEGMEKSKEEIAINLLRENLPIDLIAKSTGLTIKRIDELKKERDNNA